MTQPSSGEVSTVKSTGPCFSWVHLFQPKIQPVSSYPPHQREDLGLVKIIHPHRLYQTIPLPTCNSKRYDHVYHKKAKHKRIELKDSFWPLSTLHILNSGDWSRSECYMVRHESRISSIVRCLSIVQSVSSWEKYHKDFHCKTVLKWLLPAVWRT